MYRRRRLPAAQSGEQERSACSVHGLGRAWRALVVRVVAPLATTITPCSGGAELPQTRAFRNHHWLSALAAFSAVVLVAAACGDAEGERKPASAAPAKDGLEESIVDLGKDEPAPRAEELVDAPAPAAEEEKPSPPAETPTEEAAPAPDGLEDEPAPAVAEASPEPAIQELALLENYAATRFFPDPIVVLQGIPVRLYFSRLHREHINTFAIEPFFTTSAVILPGEVAILEFLPNAAGVFKIRNVGHGFEATLLVVEDAEEATAWRSEAGVQKLALIYRLEDGQIFPQRVVVDKDIPVRVYNLGLDAEHRVSVPPFYTAAAVNVGPQEISTFEFTPDQAGTFVIRDELHGLEATLIVR